MELLKFDTSKKVRTIRFLEPKKKHIHSLLPTHFKGGISYITCSGDDCPICSYLGKERTLRVRLVLFWQDIYKAFRKLFRNQAGYRKEKGGRR